MSVDVSVNQNAGIEEESGPWWRYPLVWMLIAGPACVVVAGFVTLWLVLRAPDPVISTDYYKEGLKINETLEKQAADRNYVPALVGRNHVVTPLKDAPAVQKP